MRGRQQQLREVSVEFLIDGEVVHSARTSKSDFKMSTKSTSTLIIGGGHGTSTRVKIPVTAATASLAGKKRAYNQRGKAK